MPDVKDARLEPEETWYALDPIFIIGRQRTGTSIMWKALQAVNFWGFSEGHLWLELVEPLARFRDHEYRDWLRRDGFTLGSERNLDLERRFALMIDAFHRDLLPPQLARWVNKSPGVYAVRLTPMLTELFPQSQFIFMKRNAITTVHSSIHYVQEKNIEYLGLMCEQWVQVMRTWREVRHLLPGRYIEIGQEEIVQWPAQVASKLAEFLNVPYAEGDLANVFKTQRENTAFPDKDIGDFFYPVSWTDEQEALLTDICREEMEIWGYPLDFRCPRGEDSACAIPDDRLERMDMTTYYRWVNRILNLEKRIAQCEESLARINHGWVMRTLNAVTRVRQRLIGW